MAEMLEILGRPFAGVRFRTRFNHVHALPFENRLPDTAASRSFP
jgi:hypothetical protein